MRLAKSLFKKCIRDIFRNIKQFISIIFIIAISCTLYIGLEANAEGFEKRVNSIFTNGNLSDIWVTINPNLNDFSEMDEDKLYVESVGGENASSETRLYMPSEIYSFSTYALISPSFPTINKPASYESDDFNDNNFFFVDEGLIKKYKDSTGNSIGLGDSLPVSFQTNTLKSTLTQVINNEETITLLIDSLISNMTDNGVATSLLENILKSNISSIQNLLTTLLNNYLSSESITYNIEVNGIMTHPENIDNGKFSNSYYLLSSRLLLSTIFSDMANKFMPENLVEFFNELKTQYEGNEVVTLLIDEVINILNDENNSSLITQIISLIINDINYSINHKSSTFIESLLSHLYNQIVLIIDPNLDADLVSNQISSYFKRKSNNNLLAVFDRKTNGSIAGITNDITQAKQLTYVFPIIFFIVAILIVLTTVAQLILKERTQIGTMKALGISKGKILLYYLSIMDIVAIIGMILGFILGPLILPHILNIKYSILYQIPALTYVFPFKVSLISLIIVLALISLLTYLLIRKELSYSASESMRVATPSFHLKARKKNIKNTSLMMTFRNIKVHMTKSIMVIIGVLGCTALLICGMGIDDTINYGKDLDLINFYNSDLVVNLAPGLENGEAKEELMRYEGIEYVEEYSLAQTQVTCNNRSINTNIYFISANSLFYKYDDNLGEGGHGDLNKVILTSQKAEKLNAKVGDTLTFNLDGKFESYEIGAIYYAFSTNGIIVYQETSEDFIRSPNIAWVKIKDGYNANDIKEELLANSKVAYSIMTYDETIDQIEGYMSSVSQMTTTIKIFAILLAVVVLINLAILNFNERKRDIATLRVLGFSMFEIASSLVYEVMILTTIGSILGLFFGMPIEMLVLGINKVDLIDWEYVIYPQTYVISFLISFLTALIVNIIISFRINKVSMSESLKSVE